MYTLMITVISGDHVVTGLTVETSWVDMLTSPQKHSKLFGFLSTMNSMSSTTALNWRGIFCDRMDVVLSSPFTP